MRLTMQSYKLLLILTILMQRSPGFLRGFLLAEGHSIFLFVDIDAADVFEAVAEFFHYEHRCECSVESEDVRPEAGRVVGEMDEGEELSCTVGACLRVVGEVGEVALNGSFVGKYHIELI